MTRHYKDLGSAFDSLGSKGGGGGRGDKKEKKEGGKKERGLEKEGREGNACYGNPALFTSAGAGVRKFLLL